jgi:tRNA-2-methylthio-N6-dimethylallyladenosine synthase
VHFAPGEQLVRPGDIITTAITRAAPHHLIADGDVISHRRTRAGDAAGQRPSGVGLGMPGVGQPAAATEPQGCTR